MKTQAGKTKVSISSCLAIFVFLNMGACGASSSENSNLNSVSSGNSATPAAGSSCPQITSSNPNSSQIDIQFQGGLQLEGGKFKACSFVLNLDNGRTIASTTINGNTSISGADSILLRREYRAVGRTETSLANAKLTQNGEFSSSLAGEYTVTSSSTSAKFTFDLARAKASSMTVKKISITLR